MIVEIALFVAVFIAVKGSFWYKQRCHRYATFQRCSINGPRPSFFFGNWRELVSTGNPNDILEIWLQRYGSVFGYYKADRPFLVISDLDLIQTLFVTKSSLARNREEILIDAHTVRSMLSFLRDDHWQRVRKAITPIFSRNKINSMQSLIYGCVKRLTEHIDNSSPTDQKVVDVDESMRAFTLDVISKTSLNMDIDVYNPKDEFKCAVRDYLETAMNPAVQMAIMLDFLRPVMTFINNYLTAGKMMNMLTERLANHIKEKVTAKRVKDVNLLTSLINLLKVNVITSEEFIANICVVILAGYETTASTLTFTLYLLAKHQSIQKRLRTDLLACGTESHYLEMVWLESMRLYPPVPLFLVREISKDIEIEGIRIEKNTHVQVPVWHIHHRDDLWKNPMQFDPERFNAENRKTIHSSAFLPFGLGPRYCIGQQLATTEVKTLLTELVLKYQIETCTESPSELPLHISTVILTAAAPTPLKFIPLRIDRLTVGNGDQTLLTT